MLDTGLEIGRGKLKMRSVALGGPEIRKSRINFTGLIQQMERMFGYIGTAPSWQFLTRKGDLKQSLTFMMVY